MPFTSKQNVHDGSAGPQIIWIPAERGILEAVMFNSISPGNGGAVTFVEIFLSSNEPARTKDIAFLASGYVGAQSSLGWTGRITLDPTYLVRALIFSDEVMTTELGVLVNVNPLTKVT